MATRTSSLLELMPVEAMSVGVEAADWRAAIVAAGRGLVAAGSTREGYTTAMIETVERFGPYIVVAPGLALAHARPSEAVLKTGLSWVSLAEPVGFGHEANDPVRVVIALAAVDHSAHQEALAGIARLASDSKSFDALTAATSVAEVRNLIQEFERNNA